MQTLIFSDICNIGYGKNAGAYLIATHLRNHGFSCQVVDYFTHYDLDELKKIIDKFVSKETLWVGFSTTFLSSFDAEINSQDFIDVIDNNVPLKEIIVRRLSCLPSKNIFRLPTQDMLDFFQYIRSKNPKIKIIIGGAKSWHAQQSDGFYRKILADYYVQGNADVSIIVLTKWLSDDSNPAPIFEGPNKNVIDSFKNYDYHDFRSCRLKFEKNDFVRKDEFLPIEIARGCIFKCKFCNFPLIGKKTGDYTRSKETIQEEFLYNYENFGTTKYMFMDETPNDSMDKVEFIHDIISGLPFKIEWGGYARLELYYANPHMKYLMKETGVTSQFFGIETFNKKSGESVGKGLHKDKIIETLNDLKNTWGEDVHLTSGFIVGLPHETKETIKDLERYMTSDECVLDAALISPLFLARGMGSIFGEDPKKYGYHHPHENNPTHWYNQHMSFDDAQEIAYGTMMRIAKKNSLQNWTLMRLHNMGLSNEELKTMTLYKFSKNLDYYKIQMTTQKDQYLAKLLSL